MTMHVSMWQPLRGLSRKALVLLQLKVSKQELQLAALLHPTAHLLLQQQQQQGRPDAE
jgi:hypothetical protein